MSRILITGATGLLGQDLVPLARTAGYDLRIMSRRPRPAAIAPEITWVQADLETGAGLQAALDGVETILHAATSPFSRTEKIDVQGTRRLLQAARGAGIEHFIFPSIVGIEKIPFAYYRHKLAAEAVVRDSGVPYIILRATQFHSLLDKFLRKAERLPLLFLPVDFKYQPIDGGEMAARLLACVNQGPAGRLPDMGGPQVHSLGELASLWLKIRGAPRRIFRLPFPGKAAQAFRRGENTTPEHAEGKVTWQDWLQLRYGTKG